MRNIWTTSIVLGCLITATLISSTEITHSIPLADRTCKVIDFGYNAPHPSHGRGANWLEPGYLLADIQLRRVGLNGMDSPMITSVLACRVISPSGRVALEPAQNKTWTNAQWLAIGAANPWINSHQRTPVWLPDGSFITQIDLDAFPAGINISAWDAPIVGAVRIANVPSYRWGNCYWEPLSSGGHNGIPNNEGGRRYWIENNKPVTNGYYITQIDLDTMPPNVDINSLDSPEIGAVRVCSLEAK